MLQFLKAKNVCSSILTVVATYQWAGGGGGSTSFPLTHTEQIDECFGARVVAVKREISISKKDKSGQG